MEFDRLVQIRVRKPGTDKQGFGSGYLIAPRLVLTAAHVVDGMDRADQDALRVARPDAGGQEFPASVRWKRLDKTVDAALIEVGDNHGWQTPESLSDLLTRPPQRFGLLVGTRPHLVTLTGFPRMQKDTDDGLRLDEQLTGHITPGTGSLAGRYEISSTDPTLPAIVPGGRPGSRWSGISGAAVLSDDGLGGDMLCGIVRRDRQADGGTRLTATPAARFLADDTFRAIVAEYTGWEPALEPVEAVGLLTPAAFDRDLNSPAALLRADAEAVTFHGRDSEVAALRSWCQDDPPAMSVRVLTGPGGQGKTRLARHLTSLLSHQGWVTGHLRPDLTDHDAPPDFTPLTTALPLLLVVDYAETRPRLLRRLITHLHRSRHRVRLLLLARSDGGWRTDPLNAAPAVRGLLDAASVVPLAPLVPRSGPIKDRLSAFTLAAQGLAHLLPRVPTVPAHDWKALAATLPPPDDLSDPRYDNALTLQLTALVTLLQRGPRPADTPPGTPPEGILLQHEGRFWEDSAEAPAFKLNLPTTTLAAAVAVAALCGATTRDEAARVISAIPGLPLAKTALTVAWLASLYPAEPDRYWGSLQPDRLAEYHVSDTLTGPDTPLPTLMAKASADQQSQGITVLARAAIAHYNANRAANSEHVLHDLNIALDATTLQHRTLWETTAALPYRSTVVGSLALRLSRQLTEALRAPAVDNVTAHEADLAQSLHNLARRLSEAGQPEKALATIEEAVEIRRRHTVDDTTTAPDLAESLLWLAQCLSEAGRPEDALAANEEASEIRRRHIADHPPVYEDDLAKLLLNLVGSLYEHATEQSNRAIHLADLGQLEEAVRATEGAVEIWRMSSTVYEPELAQSLLNLAFYRGTLGLFGQALTAAEEATAIRRRLAAVNPARFEPDLARSLSVFHPVLEDEMAWSAGCR
ncbi:tetratricopeptide repeat protein [Kitasatospora sp. NPDC059571]|uniref:tetratricopeptide repeat protein n=1 Tax=Kitasatospora sp. NPDC059571 TaxID=3346871 RepID=UPI0036BA29EC